MTGRSVPEWIGATADTKIPDRVRVRVFEREKGKCHRCGRMIRAGERWILEHITALINWVATALAPHGNRESNFGLTCCNCLPDKNAEDMAVKAKTAAVKKKHLLPKVSKMFGSRSSPWKKKLSGEVVRR